jgi:hypothetical protein
VPHLLVVLGLIMVQVAVLEEALTEQVARLWVLVALETVVFAGQEKEQLLELDPLLVLELQQEQEGTYWHPEGSSLVVVDKAYSLVVGKRDYNRPYKDCIAAWEDIWEGMPVAAFVDRDSRVAVVADRLRMDLAEQLEESVEAHTQ